MKIEIESRKSINARANKPFPEHTALISITDSDNTFVILKNKPEYLLRLKFDDITEELLDVSYSDLPPTEKAAAMAFARKHNMFNDKQAEQVATYVKSISGKVETLICQCEFGQSRSAGLAAAIRQFLHGDGIEIFADYNYSPNKMIYKKALTALKKEL